MMDIFGGDRVKAGMYGEHVAKGVTDLPKKVARYIKR